ncbi:toprim domain-containing protein [Pseudomonas gregormendelii]|uniref:Toprim domain-containing protein n=1 Tax=Pseudomonas gregormendelii TaxID=1628277 RepID=A0ABS3AKC6_9PSED|nr:toprim domain-containing protein [Pseudomonas gregormendelii]MBN3967244.1 toprim domain-containing protein [Pseudomonas gregormendelii]
MTDQKRAWSGCGGSARPQESPTIAAIRATADMALIYAPALVPELLPEGTRKGDEWWSRNPTRADRDAGSFSVSLIDGRWHDFASGDGGGDLVSLAAYVWGTRQADAARDLARRLGLHLDALEGRPADTGSSETQRQRLAAARLEAEQRQQREATEREQRHQDAASLARTLWHDSRPADPTHNYLVAKRIPATGIRQRYGVLLVPLHNLDGDLVNLQRIYMDGSKRFLSGGQVTGTFCPLGRIEPGVRIFICEGWATGVTLLAHYGAAAVVCAMNAGNLRPVAVGLRSKYGGLTDLTIAADDDRRTDGNPGQAAANAAALAAGALIATPQWPPGAPLELSDFNDLYCWEADHANE